ncbi:MAG: hypothetical protein ABI171_16685 [Collimonas sp.]|uniref:hypothetical protein n=1 Tax=Collimonas sp. TaxID=1963772 RepID=UPI003267931F
MKKIFATFALIAVSHLAWSATVMPELKKANTDICLRMGASARGAPKAPEKMPVFCGCVSDAYWSSVPQGEYDALIHTGKSPLLEANMDKRLEIAKAACLKKAG